MLAKLPLRGSCIQKESKILQNNLNFYCLEYSVKHVRDRFMWTLVYP